VEGLKAWPFSLGYGGDLAESPSAAREIAGAGEVHGGRRPPPKRHTLEFYDTEAPPPKARHPMWHFEGFQLRGPQVWVCSVILFLAGILCSAGGIGGGGVYVTVLMVAGGLDISDAVPLSKAVVFIGSIASLILNLRKTFDTEDNAKESLVDFNICRLVIPASLGGTYVGVFLNRILPSWIVATVLTLTLLAVTVMVFRTTWLQYLDENEEQCEQDATAKFAAAPQGPQADGHPRAASRGRATYNSPPRRKAVVVSPRRFTWHVGQHSSQKRGGPVDLHRRVQCKDCVFVVMVLTAVVFSSSFRFHSAACGNAEPDKVEEMCHHPFFWWLGKDTLQTWMRNDGIANFLNVFFVVFPLATCSVVVAYYNCVVVATQGWRSLDAFLYNGVSCATGILAGLVGIGGGLIISPFLIVMNLEPAVAVATSATCVIFTASSTSLQYLLTDRVIMSLTLTYGLANLAASYFGTSLVHTIQERLSRRWYISSIVGAGVLLSTVLALSQVAKHQGEH
jgi:uncharacterized membrane protein YfcA